MCQQRAAFTSPSLFLFGWAYEDRPTDPRLHSPFWASIFLSCFPHLWFRWWSYPQKRAWQLLDDGKKVVVPPFVPKIQSSMVLEERNLRNFLATLGCVLVSATAFAMVHWPDIWLMAGTGMMGVPWAVEYLLHRNVLPLGLQLGNSHGSVDLEGVFSPWKPNNRQINSLPTSRIFS